MAVDYLVGGAAALLGLFTSVQDISAARVALPSRLLLAAVIFFSVARRRSYPVPAFGALVIVAVLAAAAGPVGPPLALLAAAYVLYTVTVTGTRQTGVAALGLALAVIALIALLATGHYLPANRGGGVPVVVVGSALVIAWMTGYSVRQRRLYAVTLQHQAASSAVAEERLRIARELHDVVAHSMSVIAVQAGYGQYVIDSSPADAREALGAIQATSRDALDEMRRMLGVLRQQDAAPGPALADLGATAADGPGDGTAGSPGDGTAGSPGDGTAGSPGDGTAGSPGDGIAGSPGDGIAGRPGDGHPRPRASVPDGPGLTRAEPAPLAPAPGLADLDRLIQRTRGAGVQVAVQRSGRVRAVPAGVDLSAYRIIQEALTNVVKHAGGGVRCTVSLGYADEALEVRVTDDGGGSPALVPAGVRAGLPGRVLVASGTGHGIIGMRERANLCGGEFSAGPVPAGGFAVTAALPLPAGAGADQPRGDAP
jgi:signal transduction histidine kinase